MEQETSLLITQRLALWGAVLSHLLQRGSFETAFVRMDVTSNKAQLYLHRSVRGTAQTFLLQLNDIRYASDFT